MQPAANFAPTSAFFHQSPPMASTGSLSHSLDLSYNLNASAVIAKQIQQVPKLCQYCCCLRIAILNLSSPLVSPAATAVGALHLRLFFDSLCLPAYPCLNSSCCKRPSVSFSSPSAPLSPLPNAVCPNDACQRQLRVRVKRRCTGMRASPLRADSDDDATFQELLDAIAQSSSAAAPTAASAAPSALQAKLRSSANERQPRQLELCEVVDIVDEPAAHNRPAPQRASCVAAAAGDSSSSSDDTLAISSLVKRVTQVRLQLRVCIAPVYVF